MEYQLLVKELPEEERPRERLLAHGPKALSNAELIAIILRSGSVGKSVLEVSQKLLQSYNIRSLSRVRAGTLQNEFGVGAAKACQIVAAFELGRRAQSFGDGRKKVIQSAQDIYRYYKHEFLGLQREHVKGIYLNTRKQVIKEENLFVGTLDASLIHPRDIFQVALAEGAAALVLVHNHPSGNPQPSEEDIAITKDLKLCGEMLGIQLLDHVIIGTKKFISLKEQGFI